jgi:hypothetical protein
MIFFLVCIFYFTKKLLRGLWVCVLQDKALAAQLQQIAVFFVQAVLCVL